MEHVGGYWILDALWAVFVCVGDSYCVCVQGKGILSNRLRFAQREMSQYTRSITASIAQQETGLRAVLDSADSVLQRNREMDLEFDAMLRARYLHAQAQQQVQAQGRGNSVSVLEDTEQYYSQFHAIGGGRSDPGSGSGSGGKHSEVLIHGISTAEWDGESLLLSGMV